MKELKCPDCDASVETTYVGASVGEIMKKMHPHYMEAHKDVMASATPETQQAWMASFQADFDVAPELPEKTIECYECGKQFKAYTRDEILSELYDHYMKDHPDVIPNASDEDKKAWMERFEKDWAAA